MKRSEPIKYDRNVHFWLRKIYYFVSQLDPELSVEVTNDPENPATKGERRELEIREDLRQYLAPWRPEVITQPEAEEACEKLYEMFNFILDKNLLEIIKDPYCAGARPRRITG